MYLIPQVDIKLLHAWQTRFLANLRARATPVGRHVMERINGRWECRDCGAHATTRAYRLKLAGHACRGSVRAQAAAAGRNRTLAGEERLEHTLRERSGITYCVKCGAWSNGRKVQNLKKRGVRHRRGGAARSSLGCEGGAPLPRGSRCPSSAWCWCDTF